MKRVFRRRNGFEIESKILRGMVSLKEDCIFCRIAERDAAATIVYEDAHTLAFSDINPLNPGHTLVIPKEHYTDRLGMPEEEAGRVFASVAKVMRGVQKASNADGISVGQSNGKAASQECSTCTFTSYPGSITRLRVGFPTENRFIGRILKKRARRLRMR